MMRSRMASPIACRNPTCRARRTPEESAGIGSGVAVVETGATGAAGQTTLRILEERKFPVRELRAFASARSVGKTVTFRGEAVPVRAIEAEAFAYLAARTARGLPISYPKTTAVPQPMTGGRIVRPE